jgi:hypothetical protein
MDRAVAAITSAVNQLMHKILEEHGGDWIHARREGYCDMDMFYLMGRADVACVYRDPRLFCEETVKGLERGAFNHITRDLRTELFKLLNNPHT